LPDIPLSLERKSMAQNSTKVTSEGLGGSFGSFFRELSEDVAGVARGGVAIPDIVTEYTKDTTAEEKVEDVVDFGKLVAKGIAEDPLTFIAESLPIYGQYAAIRDSNKLVDAAKEAREQGDEKNAINLEALAATSLLGIVPLGGGLLRAGGRGARQQSGIVPSDETPPGIMSIDFDEDGNIIGGGGAQRGEDAVDITPTPEPTVAPEDLLPKEVDFSSINLQAAESSNLNGFNPDEVVPGRAFESGIFASGIIPELQKLATKKKNPVKMTLAEFDRYIEGKGLSRQEINDLKEAAKRSTRESVGSKGKTRQIVDIVKLAEVLPALDTSNRMWVSGKVNDARTGYAYGADNAEKQWATMVDGSPTDPTRVQQRVLTLNSADPRDMLGGIAATARVSSSDSDILRVNNAVHAGMQKILDEPELFANRTPDDIFEELQQTNLGLPRQFSGFVADVLDDIQFDLKDEIAVELSKARKLDMIGNLGRRTSRMRVLQGLNEAEVIDRLDEHFDTEVMDTGVTGVTEFLTQSRQADPNSRAQIDNMPEDLAVMAKFAEYHGMTNMSTFTDYIIDSLRKLEGTPVGRDSMLEEGPGLGRFLNINPTEFLDEQFRDAAAAAGYFNRPRFSYDEFISRFNAESERLQAQINTEGTVVDFDFDNVSRSIPDPIHRIMDRDDFITLKHPDFVRLVREHQGRDSVYNSAIEDIQDIYRNKALQEEVDNPLLANTTIEGRAESDNHYVFRTTDDWSAKHVAGFIRTDKNLIFFSPTGPQLTPDQIGHDIQISRSDAEASLRNPTNTFVIDEANPSILEARSVLELQNDLRGDAQGKNFGTKKDGNVLRGAFNFLEELDGVPGLNIGTATTPKTAAAAAAEFLSDNRGVGELSRDELVGALNKLPTTQNAAAILSPNISALKAAQSPHRARSSSYQRIRGLVEGSPDVNIDSLLREVDLDNAKGTGQSPYFKDLRAIREGLEAVDKLRGPDGSISKDKLTQEFIENNLVTGAPFREALIRNLSLYERNNIERTNLGRVHYASLRAFGGMDDPNNVLDPFNSFDDYIKYFVDERFNTVVFPGAEDGRERITDLIADTNSGYNEFKGIRNTLDPANEVNEPFENYARDAVGTQKKLVKAAIVDAIRQGKNAITLPGTATKPNPDFDPSISEDSAINPKRIYDRRAEGNVEQFNTSSGSEQGQGQVYTGMYSLAQSLVKELNKDMQKTGKPGKFTATLALTGRLDGKLRQPAAIPDEPIAMRVRPVIYWTPDTLEKMKFKKGGLVTLPWKRYEPGIATMIRKYRNDGVMTDWV